MKEINQSDISEFFERTLKLDIHLVAIVPDGQVNGRYFGDDIHAATEWSISQNSEGKNVYFTINIVRPGCHKKPSKADIVNVRFAHVDIDPPKGQSNWNPEERIQQLLHSRTPPTLIIWSGNGWQALWRLDNSISANDVESINRGLVDTFGGDAATINVDRLFRVPGTINFPNKVKLARGRIAQLSTIELADDGTHVSTAKLLEIYGQPRVPSKHANTNFSLDFVKMETPDTLKIPVWDTLRMLIDQPKGIDRSVDTYAFVCEALRRNFSPEKIVGVLLNPINHISSHCLDQADPLRAAKRAVESALKEEDVARRRKQRSEDQEIANGENGHLHVSPMDLGDMLERYIFIADGGQVADRNNSRSIHTLNDFKNYMAASKTLVVLPAKNGSTRKVFVPTTRLWLESAKRHTVETVTFDPSDGVISSNPDGRKAFNLWRGFNTTSPPDDWRDRVRPFTDHIAWLWGPESEPFLDWLAHLRQRPGQLPAFGWLHIAPIQGLGRNWVAGILARIFTGVTTLGFDLSAALDSGFNGMLSGKILAVVDEIAEGLSGQQHARAQALKRLVTEEVRIINPKYGRQHVEKNFVRWLILSNSLAALPLENDDRRFRVIRCDDTPKDESYYANLYALRDDAQFIASVSHWLADRDISAFNPGETPPMNAAKAELLDRVRPESERILRQIAENWRGDLICSTDIQNFLGDDRPRGAALRYSIERAGLVRVAEWQERGPVGPRRDIAYAVRNASFWKTAGIAACREEIRRIKELNDGKVA